MRSVFSVSNFNKSLLPLSLRHTSSSLSPPPPPPPADLHGVASPVLPSLILKLGLARRFSLSESLLPRLPSPQSPSLLSSLALIYSRFCRPDLALSALRLLPRVLPLRRRHLRRFLSALSAHPSTLPAALSLLRSSPPPHDAPSYTILIQALCRSGRLAIAYSLFNRLPRLNLQPDVTSYRVLIQALCRRSQARTAAGLLDDMLNKGYVPDALTYTTLLNSLCRKKMLREAYKMLCRMKARGCSPDIVHYNTLITGICRAGRPVDACKVLDDMSANECLPNLVTYTTLINGLCSVGIFEQANGYMEKAAGEGLVLHFSVFHALVKGFCRLGAVEEACGVLEVMLRQGVAPHTDTWFLILGGVCDGDEENMGAIIHKAVNEDEWRRSTKIVQPGCGVGEYMSRGLGGKIRHRGWH